MNKLEAIYKLYPNVSKTIGDVAYDKDEKEVAYDKAAVEALMAANEYKDLRAQAYPPLPDQLDYIYHNGVDAWKKDMIDPVKNKYPKG